MGLALTIARRSLLQRPGRSIFSILGIGLGIATVVGVITLDSNTVHGMAARGPAGEPDLELTPGAGHAASARELERIEGIAAVSSFFANDATIRTLPPVNLGNPGNPGHLVDPGDPGDPGRARDARKPGRPRRQTAEPAGLRRVRLYALDAGALAALEAYSVVAGRDLDPARATREVLLGAPLAEELGVEVGDEVLLARPRRAAKKECVDGQLVRVGPEQRDVPVEERFRVVGILANEGLGHRSRSRGEVVVVDFQWGSALYEGVHLKPKFWVKRDPSVDIERLRPSLAADFSYEENRAVLRGQTADERAFRTGVRMAGLLALLLGLYVIFHTLSMSLVERIGEVGTLSALGVTRGQVARTFLIEAVLLAGLGAVVGVGLGLALALGLQTAGITTLGTGKYIAEFAVPWRSVLALAGMGFGIALVGSVYPLTLLGGANTVAALRGEEALRASGVAKGFNLFAALLLVLVLPGLYFVLVPVVGEFSQQLVGVLLAGIALLSAVVMLSLLMPTILAGVCAVLTRPFSRLWPFAGRLAARTMRQSPTRIAVSASAIALVSASFVGLKGLTSSLRGEVEVWAEEAALGKVWVRDLPDVDFAPLSAHLHGFPGVLGVEKGNVKSHGQFLTLGMDVDELARYGPLARDPAALERMKSDHGIVLSKRLAADTRYRVGDPVLIEKADGSVARFSVVAISDAYGFFPSPDERMYGVVSDRYMQRYFCLDVDTVTDVAVRLEPGADPGVVEAAVRDLLPEAQEVRFQDGSGLLDFHMGDIDRDFVLFDILIALTALLAALGVLNGQLLAALERSKEIGVLKALGVSRRQVAGMVCLESGIVGLVGGGLGVAIGTAVTPMAVRALEELAGLALPQVGPGGWAGLALLGAASLALLAGAYPIWRMNRFDAVRAVRTG